MCSLHSSRGRAEQGRERKRPEQRSAALRGHALTPYSAGERSRGVEEAPEQQHVAQGRGGPADSSARGCLPRPHLAGAYSFSRTTTTLLHIQTREGRRGKAGGADGNHAPQAGIWPCLREPARLRPGHPATPPNKPRRATNHDGSTRQWQEHPRRTRPRQLGPSTSTPRTHMLSQPLPQPPVSGARQWSHISSQISAGALPWASRSRTKSTDC